ncbi:MAG: 3'-5' exonuclease [Thermoguttaceae bacterium]
MTATAASPVEAAIPLPHSAALTMIPEKYSALTTMHGNVLAAVDLETTGVQPGYHEIIQIAVVVLDSDFKPHAGVRPFYTLIKPEHPERESEQARQKHKIPMEELMLHAPTQDRVKDWLVEWWEGLRLPFKRCLVPLAHNWAFESSMLKAWLGVTMTDQLFHSHARDSMLTAISINDRFVCRGDNPPFERVGLGPMCSKLKIVNTNPHDALADCLAGAEVYRTLLQLY